MEIYKEPIAVWVLAYLYQNDEKINKRIILKELCEQSINMLDSPDQFTDILNEMVKNKIIIRFSRDQVMVKMEQIMSQQQISSDDDIPVFYKISEDGIFYFKKHIINQFKTKKALLFNSGIVDSKELYNAIYNPRNDSKEHIIKWILKNIMDAMRVLHLFYGSGI